MMNANDFPSPVKAPSSDAWQALLYINDHRMIYNKMCSILISDPESNLIWMNLKKIFPGLIKKDIDYISDQLHLSMNP